MIASKRSPKILALLSILLLVSALIVAKMSRPLTMLSASSNAFYQLKQKDNDLELAMLHIRNSMVLHYDNLRYINQDINAIFATIALLLVNEGPEMALELTRLHKQLKDKEDQTEQFKSDYSILKNAIAFLPQQLEQLISEESPNNKLKLLTLQRLFFQQFMSNETDTSLFSYLQRLKAEHTDDEKWQNILIHIEHGINKQKSVNIVLDKIRVHPAIAHISQLHGVLVKRLEEQLHKQQLSIYATYAMVALLLLFSFWALFQYHTINQKMGNLNNALAGKIDDATKSIRQEKLKVEQASQAKSLFLTRMSHELRTPLNAIIGFSQLQQMLANENTTEQQKINTEQILNAGEHLLGLINDMLDVASLDQDNIDIEIVDCELDQLLSQSVDLVSKQAQENSIVIHMTKTSQQVSADYLRLKQVVINLLTNAIKYNRANGTVTITVKEIGDEQVQIAVEDTGWGIEAVDQEKIFEPFTRLTYAEQNEIQGTGIGLAITKLLVLQMNGTIGLHSKKNTGTTFWVTLPKVKHSSLESVVATDEVEDVISNHFSVLYIEDNIASVQLLKQLFSHKYPNMTLLTTDTAEKGIDVAKSKRPDVIFIDINLPKMSGIEAIAILKNVPELSSAQMIALSADAQPEQIDKARAAGFDDYLTKPVDLIKIHDLFKRYLQQ